MDLSYTICFENYTASGVGRPRTLNCSHSLCGECAKKLLVNGKIKCPHCQGVFKYQNLDKIIINRDLINVIEWQVSQPKRRKVSAAPGVPELQHGICEEHGYQKMHHCIKHDKSVCSECVLAYHKDGDCSTIPITQYLTDKKADLCKNIDSHLTAMQASESNIDKCLNVCKDAEIRNKTAKKKLSEDYQKQMNVLEKQQSDIQKTSNQCAALKHECEDSKKKMKISKEIIEKVATVTELKSKKTKFTSQEWEKQVTDRLKQSLKEILTTAEFASSITEIFASGSSLSTNQLISRKTFATHTHKRQQRWGQVLEKDGYILLQDFRRDVPPTDAVIKNLSTVTKQASTPRQVYLNFCRQDDRRPIGQVIIRVNEETPQQAQQLIDICIGHTGDRWVGTTDIHMQYKGESKERIYFDKYLTAGSTTSDKALYTDLKPSVRVTIKQGHVLKCVNGAGFLILTGNDPASSWCSGPVIGEVVAGLSVLDKCIKENLIRANKNNTKVTISDSGLIIAPSHE